MGVLLLCEPSLGYSLNCGKPISGVQKALLSVYWECTPTSVNLASDWLRAKITPVGEEEIKIKIDDSVNT